LQNAIKPTLQLLPFGNLFLDFCMQIYFMNLHVCNCACVCVRMITVNANLWWMH